VSLADASEIACNCEANLSLAGAGCLKRIDDGTLWHVAGIGELTEGMDAEWQYCDAEEFLPSQSCDFAEATSRCESSNFAWACSFEDWCSSGCGVGRSALDENGCHKSTCTEDSECAADEACTPFDFVPIAGACGTMLGGECSCAIDPIAIIAAPPHGCFALSTVAGDGQVPPAVANCEISADEPAQLLTGVGEQQRCTMILGDQRSGEEKGLGPFDGRTSYEATVAVADGADPMLQSCCALEHLLLAGATYLGHEAGTSTFRFQTEDLALLGVFAARRDVVSIAAID
jgi:hypothetical protein